MNRAIEQSVKDKVKQIAKDQGVRLNLIWKNLVLERFLVRLGKSDHQNKLVFKGGMLLAKYLVIGRETVDLDFLLKSTPSEHGTLTILLSDILNVPVEDGFTFNELDVSELMHVATEYPVYRVSMLARLGQTKTRISIDIGVGDHVTDKTMNIALTKTLNGPIFEETISLSVYPLEYIFAEKFEAACSRGPLNSRMKDYHDLWSIIEKSELIEPRKLIQAIDQTFKTRATTQRQIPTFTADENDRLQNLWSRHLDQLKEDTAKAILPVTLSEIVIKINNWIKALDPLTG